MKKIIGKSGFVYKKEESPVERLRNKLSTLFIVIENGKCDPVLRDEALRVMPEIIEHIENIEDFYSLPKVRSFRIRHKESHYLDKDKYRIVKHRDFVSIEKLQKYGLHLYERYNKFAIGEICEMKNGKWIKLTKEEIKNLYDESN